MLIPIDLDCAPSWLLDPDSLSTYFIHAPEFSELCVRGGDRMNDWRGINTVGNGPLNPTQPQNQKLTEVVSICTRYSQRKFWYCPHCIQRSFSQSHKKGEGMDGRDRK